MAHFAHKANSGFSGFSGFSWVSGVAAFGARMGRATGLVGSRSRVTGVARP
jgi:hypothetical protein